MIIFSYTSYPLALKYVNVYSFVQNWDIKQTDFVYFLLGVTTLWLQTYINSDMYTIAVL